MGSKFYPENHCKLEKSGNMPWVICGKQISVPDCVEYQHCNNITWIYYMCGYTTRILNQCCNLGKIAIYNWLYKKVTWGGTCPKVKNV